MKQLVFISIVCSLLMACSVQKRRYLPGYHLMSRAGHAVTHKKDPVSLPTAAYRPASSVKVDTLKAESQEAERLEDPEPVLSFTGPKLRPHGFRQLRESVKHPISEWKENHGSRMAEGSAPPEEVGRKFLFTAMVGFILGIISLLLIIYGGYLIVINPVLLAVLFGVILAIIGIIAALVAFIMDLIALIQKADAPTHYYGEWMAFVSLFLCLVAFYVLIFFVLKR